MSEATRPEHWVVDGNYSAVQDIVWEAADTVVWFDLPYLTVMARMIRRTLRRTLTGEELWNGNREPLSNLWSLDPQKSIIVWAATRARRLPPALHGSRGDPRWARLCFVRLRSQAETEGFLTGVSAATMPPR